MYRFPLNVLFHKIQSIEECLKAAQIMAVATEEAGDHARWAPEDWFVDEEATGARFDPDDNSVWGLGFLTENAGGPRGALQIPRLPLISCRELRLRSATCGSL
jgi:hypothetical protein